MFLELNESETMEIDGGLSKSTYRAIGDTGAILCAGAAVVATGGWAAIAAGAATYWAMVRS